MIYLPVSRRKASQLVQAFPQLVSQESEADGRGYTSTFVMDSDIEEIWKHKELNQSLPWRYRKTPVKLRLFPTPKNCPTDALSASLSTTTFRKIRGAVTAQFGGRCQVCGHAKMNKKERRISPNVFATWLHTPHPNTHKRMGVREILGLACVCDDCLGPLTLADPIPCHHVPEPSRKREVEKSIQRMALHNQHSRDLTLKVVRKSIHQRKQHLDGLFWATNLRWLVSKNLLKPTDIVLSRQYIKQGYSLNRDCLVVPPSKPKNNPQTRPPASRATKATQSPASRMRTRRKSPA
jgi:hypothetical protein